MRLGFAHLTLGEHLYGRRTLFFWGDYYMKRNRSTKGLSRLERKAIVDLSFGQVFSFVTIWERALKRVRDIDSLGLVSDDPQVSQSEANEVIKLGLLHTALNEYVTRLITSVRKRDASSTKTIPRNWYSRKSSGLVSATRIHKRSNPHSSKKETSKSKECNH